MYAGTDVVELTPANFQKEVKCTASGFKNISTSSSAGDQERRPLDRGVLRTLVWSLPEAHPGVHKSCQGSERCGEGEAQLFLRIARVY